MALSNRPLLVLFRPADSAKGRGDTLLSGGGGQTDIFIFNLRQALAAESQKGFGKRARRHEKGRINSDGILKNDRVRRDLVDLQDHLVPKGLPTQTAFNASVPQRERLSLSQSSVFQFCVTFAVSESLSLNYFHQFGSCT